MLIEVLDSMIIGGQPREVGDVVEVDESFGEYQIRRGWARVPEPKDEPVTVAAPARRAGGRRSTTDSLEET